MTGVVHLVVGPAGHGVVRHGETVAEACGHRVVRREGPADVADADLAGADVIHVPFTDRLFGATCEEAAEAFTALAGAVGAHGASLSVTLHDLPQGQDTLARRRRDAYRTVVAGARGLVVSSRHELEHARDLDDTAWSRRVIPLPVDRGHAPPDRPGPAGTTPPATVGVLGFLYPGKGVEDVLAETPDGAHVLGIGGTAAGHADQPDHLAGSARAAGVGWEVTGYVADENLPGRLATVAVPVAPHRRVSASGSIATWIAHGRRPLVPDIPYTREIDAAWPGTVRRYAADRPGALRREIEAALDDPARTTIPPQVAVGPSLTEVARRYRDHLEACRPPAALRVGGRWTVPGNRTDLLDDLSAPDPPHVSVVIPYYDAQDHLDLVLAGLARQDHPRSRLEIVVADDGSPRPPRLDAAGPVAVRAVGQPDEGFRAGTARNLGARVADGEVIAFLDGDTVPEPGYLTALCRLPSLSDDALVVGRRRHAEAAAIRDWLAGTVPAPEPLPEPGWLAEGYAGSRDLRDADERSYRYVISAVLAMHRTLLADTGGFCEEFRSYGGEDWELAARAWHAGALFAHVPAAAAWHVGPDWAGRQDSRTKDDEHRMLARLLPDPATRPGGTSSRYPATVVVVESPDPQAVATAVAAVRHVDADAGVWWPAVRSATAPVRGGRPDAATLARAATVVHLTGEGPPEPLLACADHGVVSSVAGTARRTRAVARATRTARAGGGDPARLTTRLFGRRDLP
ncbi:glycosyltransferase [Actinomycetospora sp.]|jgi:GT2 family glycosyltransferase|uniref:glycosyltransferase n=1 Tax=Actinomycetospora sp. TaxID=1872135 RepID=UPI002F3F8E45